MVLVPRYDRLDALLKKNARNAQVLSTPQQAAAAAAAAAQPPLVAHQENELPVPPRRRVGWPEEEERVGRVRRPEVARFAVPVAQQLERMAMDRLSVLLEDTETDDCRDLVASTFLDTYGRVLREDFLPFETDRFASQCGPRSPAAAGRLLDPAEVRLAYMLIVHEEPEAVKRLIAALDEPLHNFVIHVDGKAASRPTHEALAAWAATRTNVYVMESARQNVSWGGFNVVQATLSAMDFILDTIPDAFDWIVTMSGYTYPLASNREIREALAANPADTEFIEVRPQPNVPSSRAWHQFVECDGRMRRIWRLRPPETIKMYMGSQWMVVTRDFAEYCTGRPSDRTRHMFGKNGDNFATHYQRYAKYTMVADENYFVTVLKNSPMCNRHNNTNFLHVQFDRWENQKDGGGSDNKCLQPNPKHCGRSPTTLTLEYLPVLDLGGALFARKFDARHDVNILNAIDDRRAKADGRHARQLADPAATADDGGEAPFPVLDKVRIYRRTADSLDFCVTMAPPTDRAPRELRAVTMEPCDAQNILQAFTVGPCSRDGTIDLRRDGPALVTPGKYAPAPFCPIGTFDTSRGDLCFDLERESISPGTRIIGYGCSSRWNQLFGFGTGRPGFPTAGSIFINVPYSDHIPKELCLEVDIPGEKGADTKMRVDACDGFPHQFFFVEDLP